MIKTNHHGHSCNWRGIFLTHEMTTTGKLAEIITMATVVYMCKVVLGFVIDKQRERSPRWLIGKEAGRREGFVTEASQTIKNLVHWNILFCLNWRVW